MLVTVHIVAMALLTVAWTCEMSRMARILTTGGALILGSVVQSQATDIAIIREGMNFQNSPVLLVTCVAFAIAGAVLMLLALVMDNRARG